MLVPKKPNPDESVAPELQLLFVHIPKCGGTFIQDTFAPFSSDCPTLRWKEAQGHQTYRQYKPVFQARAENIHDYLIMTVVRNPWSWHVSWYNYVRNDKRGKSSGMRIEHKQFRKMSFGDYLNWLDDESVKQSPQGYIKMIQSDWICDDAETVRADVILRQESLFDDVSRMIDKLDLDIVPTRRNVNVSTKDDYRAYYSTHGIEQIARRHQRDMELFGYDFE